MQYYPSYREYRTAWSEAYHKTPPLPLNIDIELSAACNLRCPFCLITDSKYRRATKKNPKFMPLEWVIRIINQSAHIGVPALKFNWIGEPTLHPDFNLILRYAKAYKFHDILVNTNGNYRRIKNEGLKYTTKLVYSVDSYDKNIYSKMRVGGNIVKVAENIKDLLLKKHRNVISRRVVTKENESENYRKFVNLIFDRKVKASEHSVFDRKLDSSNKENSKKLNKNIQRLYCGYPSQRLVIDTNLDVYPCCVDYRRTMKLGNIKKDSILKIWHSKKLKAIRGLLKTGKIMPSESCRDCRSWMAYDHPNRSKVSK